MAKEIKRLMAAEVRSALDAADNLLVVRLLPMDAQANHALRSALRDQGARLRVIHNRTTRHALDERRRGLGDLFQGQTALALVPGEDPDMVAVAKTLMQAARNNQLEVRGGFVEGEILDGPGVELLSKSPDKQTLRGMLAGAIVGPGRGIATTIHAVCAGLARCLKQRAEGGAAGAAES